MAPKRISKASPIFVAALLHRAVARDVPIDFQACGSATGGCNIVTQVTQVNWQDWGTSTVKMDEWIKISATADTETVYVTTDKDPQTTPPPQTIDLGNGKNTVVKYPDTPLIVTATISFDDEACASAAQTATQVYQPKDQLVFKPSTCDTFGATVPPVPKTKTVVLKLIQDKTTAPPTTTKEPEASSTNTPTPTKGPGTGTGGGGGGGDTGGGNGGGNGGTGGGGTGGGGGGTGGGGTGGGGTGGNGGGGTGGNGGGTGGNGGDTGGGGGTGGSGGTGGGDNGSGSGSGGSGGSSGGSGGGGDNGGDNNGGNGGGNNNPPPPSNPGNPGTGMPPPQQQNNNPPPPAQGGNGNGSGSGSGTGGGGDNKPPPTDDNGGDTGKGEGGDDNNQGQPTAPSDPEQNPGNTGDDQGNGGGSGGGNGGTPTSPTSPDSGNGNGGNGGGNNNTPTPLPLTTQQIIVTNSEGKPMTTNFVAPQNAGKSMTSTVVFETTNSNGEVSRETSTYTLPMADPFTKTNVVLYTDASGAVQSSTFLVMGNGEGVVTSSVVKGSLQTNAAVPMRFMAVEKQQVVRVVVIGVVMVVAAV